MFTELLPHSLVSQSQLIHLKQTSNEHSTTYTKQNPINHLDDNYDTIATYLNDGIRISAIRDNVHLDIGSTTLDINLTTNEMNIAINHTYLLRIAYYSTSHYPQEALTAELFSTTFGSVMGAHYFEKWQHVAKFDILKMIAYFGIDTAEGQKFCDMLAGQIEKYEQRIGM